MSPPEKPDHTPAKVTHDLKRSLTTVPDPLVAAQEYNKKHSPLYRIPDELLLLILQQLKDHHITLLCVRRVSRKLRQTADEILRLTWRSSQGHPPSPHFRGHVEEYFRVFDSAYKLFRMLLQMDGMCDWCKLSCLVPVDGFWKGVEQAINYRESHVREGEEGFRLPKCRFDTGCYERPLLYCSGCDLWHIEGAFSFFWSNWRDFWTQPRKNPQAPRTCFGRQGRVKLCEHVSIPWAGIERHLLAWRPWGAGGLNNFIVECRHSSHNIQCDREEPPAWPRATLKAYDKSGVPEVDLILSWAPHSGLNMPHDTEGRPAASELRALFQLQRDHGPANAIVPLYPASNSLPEMACFDPNTCHCLRYYDTAQDTHAPNTLPDKIKPTHFIRDDCPRSSPDQDNHSHTRNEDTSSSQSITMHQHFPRGFSHPACLVTTYSRHILVLSARNQKHADALNNTKLPPTHEWFHAMDPDTYDPPAGRSIWPVCRDKGCMNYYKRPMAVPCENEHEEMFVACNCRAILEWERKRMEERGEVVVSCAVALGVLGLVWLLVIWIV